MALDKPKKADLQGNIVIDENTLAFQYPNIAREWNYELR